MGQISQPAPPPSIILTAVDRLVASNADGGVNPLAAHIILFGEDTGQNLGDLDNVIALGAFALDAGLTASDLAGSIAIGVNAASSNTGKGSADLTNVENVVIGEAAMQSAVFASSSVVIGGNALRDWPGAAAGQAVEQSVVIGSKACAALNNAGAFSGNVVIGEQACTSGAGALTNNVVIGSRAVFSPAASLTGNVVIGTGAGSAMAGGANPCSQNVVIGQGAAALLGSGDDNVIIGQSANMGSATLGDQNENVLIGKASVAYGSKHVVIGFQATSVQAGAVGQRSIILGYNAGATLAAGATDICALESFDGGVTRAALYADMAKGVVILGGSAAATRDTGGVGATNLVKILDGTLGAAAPVGGFFIFGSAGDMRIQTPGPVEKIITGTFTVGTLPAAAGRAGSKAFVTDALAPVFQAAVAAGGAVFTPVYSDGVGWFVG